MKKIKITKDDKLIFDGTRVSNGHWAIALNACISHFCFTEPYQFLIEQGMSFKKEAGKRPILQAELPSMDVIMTEGSIPATITDVSISGARIVSWKLEDAGEAGTMAFRPDYINIVEDLGSYHTLSDKTNGMLSACDGENVLAVVMPMRADKESKEKSLAPVWAALQTELEMDTDTDTNEKGSDDAKG